MSQSEDVVVFLGVVVGRHVGFEAAQIQCRLERLVRLFLEVFAVFVGGQRARSNDHINDLPLAIGRLFGGRFKGVLSIERSLDHNVLLFAAALYESFCSNGNGF